MDEKKPEGAQELSDEELGRANGGKNYWKWQGKYYEYAGRQNIFYCEDWDLAYFCPNCGRLVHWGDWSRWYCDACDESWYYESNLIPNVDYGPWNPITYEEYCKHA